MCTSIHVQQARCEHAQSDLRQALIALSCCQSWNKQCRMRYDLMLFATLCVQCAAWSSTGTFAALQNLSICNNTGLTGPLPAFMSAFEANASQTSDFDSPLPMPNLQFLDASNCSFTGGWPWLVWCSYCKPDFVSTCFTWFPGTAIESSASIA